MPNWCENSLRLIGPLQTRKVFERAIAVKDGDVERYSICASLIPRPVEFEDESPSPETKHKLRMLYGADGWYDWSVINWGTKWGDCETSRAPNEFGEYFFTSAWSPPIAMLEPISVMFPDLVFELVFAEYGEGFAGAAIARDGYVLHESDNIVTPDGIFDDEGDEFEAWISGGQGDAALEIQERISERLWEKLKAVSGT